MANNNVKETILKYETFVNDILKEDLKKFQTKLQQINAEIADLIQQKHALKVVVDKDIHPSGFKAQVNVGCNFFMEASVANTSTLLMNIGKNHYLEFTIREANVYLDARIQAFEKMSQEVRQKVAETKAHIKLMLCGLRELRKDEENT